MKSEGSHPPCQARLALGTGPQHGGTVGMHCLCDLEQAASPFSLGAPIREVRMRTVWLCRM